MDNLLNTLVNEFAHTNMSYDNLSYSEIKNLLCIMLKLAGLPKGYLVDMFESYPDHILSIPLLKEFSRETYERDGNGEEDYNMFMKRYLAEIY